MITLIADTTNAVVSQTVQLVDINASVVVVIKNAANSEEFPVEVRVGSADFVPLKVEGKHILRHDSNFVTLKGRMAFRINKPATGAAVGVYLLAASHEVSVGG